MDPIALRRCKRSMMPRSEVSFHQSATKVGSDPKNENSINAMRQFRQSSKMICRFTVLSPLKGAIRSWADDTAALLDHVYFETEPMLHTSPGEHLNFSLARRPERDRPVRML